MALATTHAHPAAAETDHAPLQTGHIGLNVSDLGRSRDFYTRAFGFRVVNESSEPGRAFAFLADGDGRLVLTLWQQSAGRFDAARPGLHHLSFQADGIDAVRAIERRLREDGVKFLYDGVVPHAEGADSGGIFFEDPDGIRLEVYAPSGAASHEAPTKGAPSCGFF
jgi:catechol 2,3-dioxygenase-like lactoylglutathione lyase family enzyme